MNISYNNLVLAEDIVVFQSLLSHDHEKYGNRWVYLMTEDMSSNVRTSFLKNQYNYSIYKINNPKFEIKINYDDSNGGFDLMVKCLGFKDDGWYTLLNWDFCNPDVLVNLNNGDLQNPELFEIAFDYSKNRCVFLKKDTDIYNQVYYNSTEKALFEMSKKTSKRKLGHQYITRGEKLYYLGDLWKLGFDSETKCYKKEQVKAYVNKLFPDETPVLSEIINNRLQKELVNLSENVFRPEKIRCFVKSQNWVDCGEQLKNDLPDDFDIRDTWESRVKNFINDERKPYFRYSNLFYYTNLAKFYSIFVFGNLNTTLEEDKLKITDTIRKDTEDIIRKNIYRSLFDIYSPNDSTHEYLKSYPGKRYNSLCQIENYSKLKETVIDMALVSQIGHNSNLDGFYSNRSQHFKMILTDLIGINIESLVDDVIAEFKSDVNHLGHLPTWQEFVDWQDYIQSRYVNKDDASIIQVNKATVAVTGKYNLDERMDLLEDHFLFIGRPKLKKLIIDIYNKAKKNSGKGTRSFEIFSTGSGKSAYRELRCTIDLDDIIDYFGGKDKVPTDTIKEIVGSMTSTIKIVTNNTDYNLK